MLDLGRIHEREAGHHVSGTPAVHGSVANLAVGIAPLPEREVSHRLNFFKIRKTGFTNASTLHASV